MLETNAQGVFLTNQAAVRQMLAQPLDDSGLRGTVLNMGSVLGLVAVARRFRHVSPTPRARGRSAR